MYIVFLNIRSGQSFLYNIKVFRSCLCPLYKGTKSEQRYSSTHSSPQYYIEVFNLTTKPLYPQKRIPVPTEQHAELAPESIWTYWRREKSLIPARIRTPGCLVRSVVAIPTTLSCLPEILFYYVSISSWYLTENTLHFRYTDQYVNALKEYICSLLFET